MLIAAFMRLFGCCDPLIPLASSNLLIVDCCCYRLSVPRPLMVAACHSASCFAHCFVFWQLLLLVAEYSKFWGEWWAAVEDAMVGWEANSKSTNEERQGTAAQTS